MSIFNAYVSKYWPPAEYSLDLISPDTFTWQMSRMHIRFFDYYFFIIKNLRIWFKSYVIVKSYFGYIAKRFFIRLINW